MKLSLLLPVLATLSAIKAQDEDDDDSSPAPAHQHHYRATIVARPEEHTRPREALAADAQPTVAVTVPRLDQIKAGLKAAIGASSTSKKDDETNDAGDDEDDNDEEDGDDPQDEDEDISETDASVDDGSEASTNSTQAVVPPRVLSAKSHKAVKPRAAAKPYLNNAHTAITTMMTFYNSPRAGFWTNGWWNSANCYTLLADLRSRDDSAFIKKLTDGPNGLFAKTIAVQNKNKYGGLAWDDWFDDMQWWAVGLIKAYDVTGDRSYLKSARETWQVVQNEARNAVCGGLYNARPGVVGRGQSVIATLLYVEVTASFAKRYPKEKAAFLKLAKGQWSWVMNNAFQYNYIRGDGLKKVNGQCTHNGAILSYLEGAAINAAIALNAVTGDYSYIDTANSIATKSFIDKGLNRSGILHDNCDMNFGCNPDEAQFKGIFMRALRNLYEVQPSAANGQIPQFLKQNADSIWNKARGKNNLLGQRWDGPFNSANNLVGLAQHSSATMALVAAALL